MHRHARLSRRQDENEMPQDMDYEILGDITDRTDRTEQSEHSGGSFASSQSTASLRRNSHRKRPSSANSLRVEITPLEGGAEAPRRAYTGAVSGKGKARPASADPRKQKDQKERKEDWVVPNTDQAALEGAGVLRSTSTGYAGEGVKKSRNRRAHNTNGGGTSGPPPLVDPPNYMTGDSIQSLRRELNDALSNVTRLNTWNTYLQKQLQKKEKAVEDILKDKNADGAGTGRYGALNKETSLVAGLRNMVSDLRRELKDKNDKLKQLGWKSGRPIPEKSDPEGMGEVPDAVLQKFREYKIKLKHFETLNKTILKDLEDTKFEAAVLRENVRLLESTMGQRAVSGVGIQGSPQSPKTLSKSLNESAAEVVRSLQKETIDRSTEMEPGDEPADYECDSELPGWAHDTRKGALGKQGPGIEGIDASTETDAPPYMMDCSTTCDGLAPATKENWVLTDLDGDSLYIRPVMVDRSHSAEDLDVTPSLPTVDMLSVGTMTDVGAEDIEGKLAMIGPPMPKQHDSPLSRPRKRVDLSDACTETEVSWRPSGSSQKDASSECVLLMPGEDGTVSSLPVATPRHLRPPVVDEWTLTDLDGDSILVRPMVVDKCCSALSLPDFLEQERSGSVDTASAAIMTDATALFSGGMPAMMPTSTIATMTPRPDLTTTGTSMPTMVTSTIGTMTPRADMATPGTTMPAEEKVAVSTGTSTEAAGVPVSVGTLTPRVENANASTSTSSVQIAAEPAIPSPVKNGVAGIIAGVFGTMGDAEQFALRSLLGGDMSNLIDKMYSSGKDKREQGDGEAAEGDSKVGPGDVGESDKKTGDEGSADEAQRELREQENIEGEEGAQSGNDPDITFPLENTQKIRGRSVQNLLTEAPCEDNGALLLLGRSSSEIEGDLAESRQEALEIVAKLYGRAQDSEQSALRALLGDGVAEFASREVSQGGTQESAEIAGEGSQVDEQKITEKSEAESCVADGADAKYEGLSPKEGSQGDEQKITEKGETERNVADSVDGKDEGLCKEISAVDPPGSPGADVATGVEMSPSMRGKSVFDMVNRLPEDTGTGALMCLSRTESEIESQALESRKEAMGLVFDVLDRMEQQELTDQADHDAVSTDALEQLDPEAIAAARMMMLGKIPDGNEASRTGQETAALSRSPAEGAEESPSPNVDDQADASARAVLLGHIPDFDNAASGDSVNPEGVAEESVDPSGEAAAKLLLMGKITDLTRNDGQVADKSEDISKKTVVSEEEKGAVVSKEYELAENVLLGSSPDFKSQNPAAEGVDSVLDLDQKAAVSEIDMNEGWIRGDQVQLIEKTYFLQYPRHYTTVVKMLQNSQDVPGQRFVKILLDGREVREEELRESLPRIGSLHVKFESSTMPEEATVKYLSAQVIQAMVRGRLAYVRYTVLKGGSRKWKHLAAIRIQRFFRGYKSRQRVSKWRGLTSSTANQIEKWYDRSLPSPFRAAEEALRREKCAVKVQATYRMFAARKGLQDTKVPLVTKWFDLSNDDELRIAQTTLQMMRKFGGIGPTIQIWIDNVRVPTTQVLNDATWSIPEDSAGMMCMKIEEECLNKLVKHTSAVHIQKSFRGFFVRQSSVTKDDYVKATEMLHKGAAFMRMGPSQEQYDVHMSLQKPEEGQLPSKLAIASEDYRTELELKTVDHISKGHATAAFQVKRDGPRIPARSRCFSIVTRFYTTDLIAKSTEERDSWVRALKVVMNYAPPTESRVTIELDMSLPSDRHVLAAIHGLQEVPSNHPNGSRGSLTLNESSPLGEVLMKGEGTIKFDFRWGEISGHIHLRYVEAVRELVALVMNGYWSEAQKKLERILLSQESGQLCLLELLSENLVRTMTETISYIVVGSPMEEMVVAADVDPVALQNDIGKNISMAASVGGSGSLKKSLERASVQLCSMVAFKGKTLEKSAITAVEDPALKAVLIIQSLHRARLARREAESIKDEINRSRVSNFLLDLTNDYDYKMAMEMAKRTDAFTERVDAVEFTDTEVLRLPGLNGEPTQYHIPKHGSIGVRYIPPDPCDDDFIYLSSYLNDLAQIASLWRKGSPQDITSAASIFKESMRTPSSISFRLNCPRLYETLERILEDTLDMLSVVRASGDVHDHLHTLYNLEGAVELFQRSAESIFKGQVAVGLSHMRLASTRFLAVIREIQGAKRKPLRIDQAILHAKAVLRIQTAFRARMARKEVAKKKRTNDQSNSYSFHLNLAVDDDRNFAKYLHHTTNKLSSPNVVSVVYDGDELVVYCEKRAAVMERKGSLEIFFTPLGLTEADIMVVSGVVSDIGKVAGTYIRSLVFEYEKVADLQNALKSNPEWMAFRTRAPTVFDMISSTLVAMGLLGQHHMASVSQNLALCDQLTNAVDDFHSVKALVIATNKCFANSVSLAFLSKSIDSTKASLRMLRRQFEARLKVSKVSSIVAVQALARGYIHRNRHGRFRAADRGLVGQITVSLAAVPNIKLPFDMSAEDRTGLDIWRVYMSGRSEVDVANAPEGSLKEGKLDLAVDWHHDVARRILQALLRSMNDSNESAKKIMALLGGEGGIPKKGMLEFNIEKGTWAEDELLHLNRTLHVLSRLFPTINRRIQAAKNGRQEDKRLLMEHVGAELTDFTSGTDNNLRRDHIGALLARGLSSVVRVLDQGSSKAASTLQLYEDMVKGTLSNIQPHWVCRKSTRARSEAALEKFRDVVRAVRVSVQPRGSHQALEAAVLRIQSFQRGAAGRMKAKLLAQQRRLPWASRLHIDMSAGAVHHTLAVALAQETQGFSSKDSSVLSEPNFSSGAAVEREGSSWLVSTEGSIDLLYSPGVPDETALELFASSLHDIAVLMSSYSPEGANHLEEELQSVDLIPLIVRGPALHDLLKFLVTVANGSEMEQLVNAESKLKDMRARLLEQCNVRVDTMWTLREAFDIVLLRIHASCKLAGPVHAGLMDENEAARRIQANLRGLRVRRGNFPDAPKGAVSTMDKAVHQLDLTNNFDRMIAKKLSKEYNGFMDSHVHGVWVDNVPVSRRGGNSFRLPARGILRVEAGPRSVSTDDAITICGAMNGIAKVLGVLSHHAMLVAHQAFPVDVSSPAQCCLQNFRDRQSSEVYVDLRAHNPNIYDGIFMMVEGIDHMYKFLSSKSGVSLKELAPILDNLQHKMQTLEKHCLRDSVSPETRVSLELVMLKVKACLKETILSSTGRGACKFRGLA